MLYSFASFLVSVASDVIKTKRSSSPNLAKVAEFEKNFVYTLESIWSDTQTKTKGSLFSKKFSKLSWESFFTGAGLDSWKSAELYYKSPRWIRHIGKLLQTTPIEVWKLLIARSYIIGSLKFLPPPFDELEFMRNKTDNPDLDITDLTVGMFKQSIEDEFEK
jgi:predicted metalloendopeptidase